MTRQRRNDRTTFQRRTLVCVSDPSVTIQNISLDFFLKIVPLEAINARWVLGSVDYL